MSENVRANVEDVFPWHSLVLLLRPAIREGHEQEGWGNSEKRLRPVAHTKSANL
jgi:hypothetical protein